MASSRDRSDSGRTGVSAARRLSLFGERAWEFRGYGPANAYCGRAFVGDRPAAATVGRPLRVQPAERTTAVARVEHGAATGPTAG